MGDKGSFIRVIIRLGVVSVALSVTTLLVASAMMTGFKQEITNKIYDFWGHIHITHLRSDRSVDVVPISLDSSLLTQVSAIKSVGYKDASLKQQHTHGGVAHVAPFIHYPAVLSTKEDYEAALAKGVDERFDWEGFDKYIVEGSSSDFVQGGSTVCVLSRIQADRLDVTLGDHLLMHFIEDNRRKKRRYKVVAIYETGLQEYDEKFAILPLASIQNVMGWTPDVVTGLSVVLDDDRDMTHINEYLYLEVIPQALYSEAITEKFPAIFEWLDLQKTNEWVVLVIMLVVCFVNLSTVMIVLILERAHMIGVFKAIGARTGTIIRIFVLLLGRVLLQGLIVGNVLALVLIWLQDRYHLIKLNQADYYLSYAPVYLPWMTWLGINIFVFVVVILFMFIPGLIISSIRPTSILRFK